jgi:hypothetical protein
MNHQDRELLKTLSDLTADVRSIKESNQDIKSNMSGLQARTANLEITMTKIEANQPTKIPWYAQVTGIGALVVLGLNAPALLTALQKGIGS